MATIVSGHYCETCKKISYAIVPEDKNKLQWEVEGNCLYSQCPGGFQKLVEELRETVKSLYGKYTTFQLNPGMEKTARHSLELPTNRSFVWKASHGSVSEKQPHPIQFEESTAENLAKRTHSCFEENKKNTSETER